jgi:hypothetical protein
MDCIQTLRSLCFKSNSRSVSSPTLSRTSCDLNQASAGICHAGARYLLSPEIKLTGLEPLAS